MIPSCLSQLCSILSVNIDSLDILCTRCYSTWELFSKASTFDSSGPPKSALEALDGVSDMIKGVFSQMDNNKSLIVNLNQKVASTQQELDALAGERIVLQVNIYLLSYPFLPAST